MEGMSRMTVSQLRYFDGKQSEGVIYVALAGKIYNVSSEAGRQFYGKGAPYEVFAGRDATRALATMSMCVKDEYDDLDDLTPAEKEAVKRWQGTFNQKYTVVGELMKG